MLAYEECVMFPSPTRMFLTKGVGVHRHALTAFEFALRDADIEQQNLVYVSSILPPRCKVITSRFLRPTRSSAGCWPQRGRPPTEHRSASSSTTLQTS